MALHFLIHKRNPYEFIQLELYFSFEMPNSILYIINGEEASYISKTTIKTVTLLPLLMEFNKDSATGLVPQHYEYNGNILTNMGLNTRPATMATRGNNPR